MTPHAATPHAATPDAATPDAAMLSDTLVVVPCLDEEAHIDALLAQLRRTAPGALIVVADGGSRDRTRAVVRRHAGESALVRLLDNPRRIQSAAVNRAVERFGADRSTLVRIDAHCLYPDDYVVTLLREAARTGADSVVVAMETRGRGAVQCAVAAAQNGRIGNGGSAHRSASTAGEWVDHGHHALMRIKAFRAVGGYDETFTHNEDAELDLRLAAAGFRIWLTRETAAVYLPRDTFGGLWRQYRAYGRGRARTVLKHRARPRLRQMVPLAVAPALLALPAAPFAAAAVPPLGLLMALPALLWLGVCALSGLRAAWSARRFALALAGPAAATMHAAWSFGFWEQLARHLGPATAPAPLPAEREAVR